MSVEGRVEEARAADEGVPVSSGGGSSAGPVRRSPGVLGWAQAHWGQLLAVLVYLVLSLAGVTTVNTGVAHLTQDGVVRTEGTAGDPRGIRSDEYNVFTPIDLSILASGDEPTLSPLSEDGGLVHRFATGPFSSVTFFDSAILRVPFVSENVLFAAKWWLPVLVLVLALPSWFGRLGMDRRWGWLAVGLVLASPSVAWWSYFPVRAFAYTVAGATVLLIASRSWAERRRLAFAGQSVVAGVLLAGIPSFYIPWSVALGIPFLLATVLSLLSRRGVPWRDRLVPVVAAGGIAGMLAVGTLYEFRQSIDALLGTVYPGSRASGPQAQPVEMLFGAPGLGGLQDHDPVSSNASELSTSFTVALVLALLVMIVRRSRLRRLGAEFWVLLGATVIWFGWASISVTNLGSMIPLLNRVPSPRAAQVVGVLAVLCLCMVLDRLGRLSTRGALVVSAGAALITAYATSRLREGPLPTVSSGAIVATAVLTAVVVALVMRFGHRWWALLFAVLIAFLPSWRVNPVVVGIGDLRDSTTAQSLARAGVEARQDGELWATDHPALNSVMLANGLPSLSGFQRSGPDRSVWSRLDPQGTFEDAWNRGGGYVGFAFAPGGALSIGTDGFDQIWVTVDPCDLVSAFPEVTHLVSASDLGGTCLTPVDELRWGGTDLTVYQAGAAG